MPRHLAAIAIVLGATACLPLGAFAVIQSYYSRGDFDHDYGDRAHALATVGCIDIAPSLREASGTLLIDWRMGNHCGSAVDVDLSKLRLYAVTTGGETAPWSLVDPKAEVRSLPLAGRSQAFERMALRGPGSPSELCVAVTAIAPGASSDSGDLCFAKREAAWLVTTRHNS